ncbi:MAG: L,D-transpeptidase family protein [Oscillospiraceae bacterium]|nr:L,D-transpeptidase family protein [Oscillospiraceae bacterium]
MHKKLWIPLLIGVLLYSACGTTQETFTPSTQEETEEAQLDTAPETAPLVKTESETETGFSLEIILENVLPSETETESETEFSYEAIKPYLTEGGLTEEDLTDTGQVIIVRSSYRDAEVFLVEKSETGWSEYSHTYGVVGKNGVSSESREGDYRTPKGFFPLGFAFGTEELDTLNIEYRKINSNCYFVDDPESEFYNQWVESDSVTWNSAEHLADYPTAYHYSVVIDYNMNPVVPYAGSAIFLHVMTGSYTAGCVAVPKSDMIDILYWLNDAENPMILIY